MKNFIIFSSTSRTSVEIQFSGVNSFRSQFLWMVFFFRFVHFYYKISILKLEMWQSLTHSLIMLSTLSSHDEIQSHFNSRATDHFDWMYRLQNTWITAKNSNIAHSQFHYHFFLFSPLSVSRPNCITQSKASTAAAMMMTATTTTTTARKQQSELMGNIHGDWYRHMEGNEKIHERKKNGWLSVYIAYRRHRRAKPKSYRMRDSCKKKYFFFFLNQVNDECKVGHFADTYKYMVARASECCVAFFHSRVFF